MHRRLWLSHAGAAVWPDVLEIIFDHFAFVPKAKDEFFVPMVGAGLYETPQDRAITDRKHWLGAELRFFPQPHPFAAAQNYNFHVLA